MFLSVRATLPEGTPVYDVSKMLGRLWGELSAAEKHSYLTKYNADFTDHERVSHNITILGDGSHKVDS